MHLMPNRYDKVFCPGARTRQEWLLRSLLWAVAAARRGGAARWRGLAARRQPRE